MAERRRTRSQQKLDCWTLAEAALDLVMEGIRVDGTPLVQNILLYGPPGTGKSYFAQRYGLDAVRGAEVVNFESVDRVYLTEETPAAELRGSPLPDGKEWHWCHGPAIRAWQGGTRLVLEEIDQASGDALTFLLAVCDDPAVAGITLPNGEFVRPQRGFHVIATTNAGPGDLPEALEDRFTVTIAINEPHPAAINSLGADLRDAARVTAGLEPERRVSIRKWRDFDIVRQHRDERLAAALAFGARSQDVLDALRIGARADTWEPARPCYWVERERCQGDGRGTFLDRDGDAACAGCALTGQAPAPIRSRDGTVVRAA